MSQSRKPFPSTTIASTNSTATMPTSSTSINSTARNFANSAYAHYSKGRMPPTAKQDDKQPLYVKSRSIQDNYRWDAVNKCPVRTTTLEKTCYSNNTEIRKGYKIYGQTVASLTAVANPTTRESKIVSFNRNDRLPR